MKKEFDIENVDYEVNKKNPFRRIFFSIILLCVLTVIYARYLGTSGLFVKEYNIKSNKITDTYNGLKIVHFSDFHYGRTTFIKELNNLVSDINKTKPDIIVFTGDLIDKDVLVTDDDINKIIESLWKLESTYGNYYVAGNHDRKRENYDQIMESSNFVNLNNSYDVIYNSNNESILITGLDIKDDTSVLDNVFKQNYNYKINIMHYPDYFEKIELYNYDLVLAGHSHNGQIAIPFYGAIVKVNHAKKYYKPYYKVGDTRFYISSGIGTSNYNFRFFNRPSYNLYRLTKE